MKNKVVVFRPDMPGAVMTVTASRWPGWPAFRTQLSSGQEIWFSWKMEMDRARELKSAHAVRWTANDLFSPPGAQKHGRITISSMDWKSPADTVGCPQHTFITFTRKQAAAKGAHHDENVHLLDPADRQHIAAGSCRAPVVCRQGMVENRYAVHQSSLSRSEGGIRLTA